MGVGTGIHNAITRAISSLVGIVSPSTALRYKAGREAMLAYDAGRRDGPNGSWLPRDDMADRLINRDRKLVQARARALALNSPNVAGALRKIANNVVFTGIMPQVQLKDASGKRLRTYNAAIENEFRIWAEAVDFFEMQLLGVRHLWLDGGYLIYMHIEPVLFDAGLVPLRPQLIELDALDRSVHGVLPNGNIAFYGQEYTPQGTIAAYHIVKRTPFGFQTCIASNERIRLDAAQCHKVMLRERIGQTMPISWMASVIMTMHDFNEYQSSERIAARLAAAFGVFVTLPAQDMGGNYLDGSPVGGTLGALAGGHTTSGSIIAPEKFIGTGRIDVLPPGADISIAKADRPGQTFEPYSRTTLRNASAGFCMSAEAYSNDYSAASYSSARSASLEERRGYRVQQHLVSLKHNAPIWREWCNLRSTFGMGDEAHGKVLPVRWQVPGWQWVDPAKDANAAETKLRLGLTTRRDLCAEAGVDFDEVLEGLAEERAELLARGLDPEPWDMSAQPDAPPLDADDKSKSKSGNAYDDAGNDNELA